MPAPAALSLIQARLSSSRLPGKVLLPLAGRPVIDHVIDRCSAFSTAVVVCTSDDPSDDALAAHCDRRGVLCVRGSLADVFGRFRAALADRRMPASDWFFRVTADCPLVSAELAESLLDRAAAAPELDWIGVAGTAPLGTAVELVRRAAFCGIDPATLDAAEREHVTLRLHEDPTRYRCERVEPPLHLRAPDVRLTLDYPADYDVLAALFDRTPTLDAATAIDHLRCDVRLAARNQSLRQKSPRVAS